MDSYKPDNSSCLYSGQILAHCIDLYKKTFTPNWPEKLNTVTVNGIYRVYSIQIHVLALLESGAVTKLFVDKCLLRTGEQSKLEFIN